MTTTMTMTTKRPWLLLLPLPILAACNDGMQVGSVHVKSKLIVASEGGTIEVTEADHPLLAGTAITIPPGALPQDMTVGIGFSDASLALADTRSDGPAVYFAPIGTELATPAHLTLPFDEDADPAKLRVHAVVDGAATDVSDLITGVDADQLLVDLDLAFLGDVGVHTLFFGPGDDAGCNGVFCGEPDAGCTPATCSGPDAGVPDPDAGCVGLLCPPDPDAGNATCTFGSCPPGMACSPAGLCIDNPACEGVTCGVGEACNGEYGECAAACGMGGFISYVCAPGEVCDFENATCYTP